MEQDRLVIKQRLAEHYDQRTEEYIRGNYGEGETRNASLKWRQRYIEQMIADQNLPQAALILDVGCGPGELLLSLARSGYTVSGIDISKEMIGAARALLTRAAVSGVDRLAVGDIEQLEFEDETFDVVVASGVIEYQRDDHVSLSEMGRVLRPRGYLILNVTSRYAYLNWFDNTYRMLKRHRATRAVVGFLKERVFLRGSLNEFPERRTHAMSTFDKTLVRHGFRKLSYNMFHFSPLPTPLDSVFAPICKPLGQRMERLTRHPLGRLLGGGYIVLAEKTARDAHATDGAAATDRVVVERTHPGA